MPATPIPIKRYPNRRYYARHTSKYVSLQQIEEMIKEGEKVEIRDSQTGKDITRAVLTQIILERQPEKISLFPSDMLHFILRSNDVMSDFLRDYFRHSLTYLEYLQQLSPTTPLTRPMHWVKAWLDQVAPQPPSSSDSDSSAPPPLDDTPVDETPTAEPEATAEPDELNQRIELLETRIRQLEAERP